MFNDGEIANKLALSKTKCAYLINHGTAPFYKDILLETSKILLYMSQQCVPMRTNELPY